MKKQRRSGGRSCASASQLFRPLLYSSPSRQPQPRDLSTHNRNASTYAYAHKGESHDVQEAHPHVLHTPDTSVNDSWALLQRGVPSIDQLLRLRTFIGALIIDVEPGGIAARAGLATGDVLGAVGGHTLRDLGTLEAFVSALRESVMPGGARSRRCGGSTVCQAL